MVSINQLFKLLSLSALAVAAPMPRNSTLGTLKPRDDFAELPGYVSFCHADSSVSFDDGPYIWTKELVDHFMNAGATSTLFVNGNNFRCIYDEDMVEALRYAHENGFTIGVHTWNHHDLRTRSIDYLANDLDLIEEALWKIIGVKPALFRPPYGSIDEEKIEYLNSRDYTVVGWSDDIRDTMGASIAEQEAAMWRTGTGTMMLAHEVKENTVHQVIPNTLSGLVSAGTKFVTVDQCLGVSPYHLSDGGYQERDDSWTCYGTPAPGQ